jgi:hypothetical protein
MKSGNLNLLEPSGPVQGYTRITLLYFTALMKGSSLETNT